MLVKYKKALEKIAMGLLSYMPLEKDVKRLMETIQQYEKDEQWQLYLWKQDEEYIGVIGVVLEDNIATVRHITVHPPYRGEGIAKQMVEHLQDKLQVEEIRPCTETASFMLKCKDLLEETSPQS